MIDLFSYSFNRTERQLNFELGLVMYNRGATTEAIECFKDALLLKDSSPSDEEIYLALGNAQFKNGFTEPAIIAFLHAATVSEKNANVIVQQAADHFNVQNVSKLSEWFTNEWKQVFREKISEKIGKSTIDYFEAMFLLAGGEFKSANDLFDEIIKANPDDHRSYLGKAVIQKKIGERNDLETILLRAKELSNNDSSKLKAVELLIEHYQETGEFVKAQQELVAIGPERKDRNYYYLKAYNSYCLQQNDLARNFLEEARKLNGQHTDLLKEILQIKIETASREYETALSRCNAVLQMDPLNVDIQFLKIEALIEGQIDIEEGLRIFTEGKYGFVQLNGWEYCLKYLLRLMKERPLDGNLFFFAAFLAATDQRDRPHYEQWIKEAETLGMSLKSDHQRTGLTLLYALVAENAGDQQKEAGLNYFTVAKDLYYRGVYTKAIHYFGKAVALYPENSDQYGFYSDALLMAMVIPDPPFIQKQLVEKAYKVYNNPNHLLIHNTDNAWENIVLGLIHENLYLCEQNSSSDDHWLSILHTERALHYAKDRGNFWAYLGKFYRNLGLTINTRKALEIGKKLTSEDNWLDEQYFMVLLDTGQNDIPREYLSKLKVENRIAAHHKEWEAFAFYTEGEYESALIIIESAININPKILWSYVVACFCYMELRKWDLMVEKARAIQQLFKDYTYYKEDYSLSWALYFCDEVEKAIEIQLRYIKRGDTSHNSLFTLAIFYLFVGKVSDAETYFQMFLQDCFNARLLDEFQQTLHSVLPLMKHRGKTLVSGYEGLVNRWTANLSFRKQQIPQVGGNPIVELQAKQNLWKYPQGSIPYIALKTSLARWYRSDENFAEALAIYKDLLSYKSLFPEAEAAIEVTKQELSQSIKRNFEEKNFNQCLNLINIGLNQAVANNYIQSEFLNNLCKEFNNSTSGWHFAQFIERNRSSLLFQDAETTIWAFWDQQINFSYNLVPGVTEFSINLSDDLAREKDSTDWYVTKELVPRLREELKNSIGIVIPVVRFWADTYRILDKGNYMINLFEVPFVLGKVEMGKLFVDQPELIQDLPLERITAFHPITGKSAAWVDASHKEELTARGCPFSDDPFEYIMMHIKWIFVKLANRFIDLQYAHNYLTNAAELDHSDQEIGLQIDADYKKLLLFYQALRGLLIEGISISNKNRIIISFNKAVNASIDINIIVQHIREDIKDLLPQNVYSPQLVELDDDTEAKLSVHVQYREAKSFLELSFTDYNEVMPEIRDKIGEAPLPYTKALVIKQSDLRIHVFRLCQYEYPNLIVSSTNELNKHAS